MNASLRQKLHHCVNNIFTTVCNNISTLMIIEVINDYLQLWHSTPNTTHGCIPT